MVDGIDIYTESSAGHHIHAVRSKHATKREEAASQVSLKAKVYKMVVGPEMMHV